MHGHRLRRKDIVKTPCLQSSILHLKQQAKLPWQWCSKLVAEVNESLTIRLLDESAQDNGRVDLGKGADFLCVDVVDGQGSGSVGRANGETRWVDGVNDDAALFFSPVEKRRPFAVVAWATVLVDQLQVVVVLKLGPHSGLDGSVQLQDQGTMPWCRVDAISGQQADG